MRLLLLLFALLFPARPELTATWEGPKKARITWTSGAASVCVDRVTTGGASYLLGCYKGSGALLLPGSGPNDFAYFPKRGDVYCATFDYGERVCAPLLWRVGVPLIKKEGQGHSTALPLITNSLSSDLVGNL